MHAYLVSQAGHVTCCFSLKSLLLHWLLLKLGRLGRYFKCINSFKQGFACSRERVVGDTLSTSNVFVSCALRRKSHDAMCLRKNIKCWGLILLFSAGWVFLTMCPFSGCLTLAFPPKPFFFRGHVAWWLRIFALKADFQTWCISCKANHLWNLRQIP